MWSFWIRNVKSKSKSKSENWFSILKGPLGSIYQHNEKWNPCFIIQGVQENMSYSNSKEASPLTFNDLLTQHVNNSVCDKHFLTKLSGYVKHRWGNIPSKFYPFLSKFKCSPFFATPWTYTYTYHWSAKTNWAHFDLYDQVMVNLVLHLYMKEVISV